ncbi:MAG: hypothetical protein FJ213_09470 [Ignavibacteria bacterium]|nr:hypothetical protein [Ignavibacteria bacterium]
MNKAARLISTVFLPPTFSLFNFVFLNFYFLQNDFDLFLNLVITITATVILPIIYFVLQRRRGIILDNDAVIKEQRNGTYLFTIIIFFIAAILLLLNLAPAFVTALMLCYAVNTTLVYFVNAIYKISIHTFTAAGSFALFTLISPILSLVLFIILMLVMWSRIQLKVHTAGQVALGLVCGISLTLIGMKYFVIILELWN